MQQLLKTIEQKPGADDFAKARELIEVRGSEDLTLQDRRIINLLYANAGLKLCDDIRHVIGIAELRGTHNKSRFITTKQRTSIRNICGCGSPA